MLRHRHSSRRPELDCEPDVFEEEDRIDAASHARDAELEGHAPSRPCNLPAKEPNLRQPTDGSSRWRSSQKDRFEFRALELPRERIQKILSLEQAVPATGD